MGKMIMYDATYCLIIFTIGGIATHNEDIITSLIINLWFSIPMSISYFFELLFLKKASKTVYFILAIANTVIMGGILCVIGSYILYNYMYIPF